MNVYKAAGWEDRAVISWSVVRRSCYETCIESGTVVYGDAGDRIGDGSERGVRK